MKAGKNWLHISTISIMIILMVPLTGPAAAQTDAPVPQKRTASAKQPVTAKEVQDTDGDGLPEFVDAWGQPLQFFRWPLLYHSELQRGQTIT